MEYNTKIIEYDDYIHIQHYDKTIKRGDFSKQDQQIQDILDEYAVKLDSTLPEKLPKDEEEIERILKVSVNRSKNNLFYIARSNKWDMFATFTFDRNDTDSSDYNLVSKRMTTFFNNIKRSRCPDLKYLVVPELHKDKIHYHFHALIANCNGLNLVDSGHVDSLGSKVYNLKDWKWGFSTVVFIQDQARVKNYIGKYITKDLMNKLKFKKRYYCSTNVELKKQEFSCNTFEELLEKYQDRITYAKTTTINGINRIQYLEVKK